MALFNKMLHEITLKDCQISIIYQNLSRILKYNLEEIDLCSVVERIAEMERNCIILQNKTVNHSDSIGTLFDLHHQKYSPNGRFLVQETFPKTLPRFVLILIYRSTERQRNQAFCVTAADWSTITLHDSASKQRWFDYHNQHESTVLIGLFHAASLVLPPVES